MEKLQIKEIEDFLQNKNNFLVEVNNNLNKEETEEYFKDILNKMKAKDSQFELNVEYGKLLMKNINNFTENELKRYKELEQLLYGN